jgi:hypothetical protein
MSFGGLKSAKKVNVSVQEGYALLAKLQSHSQESG